MGGGGGGGGGGAIESTLLIDVESWLRMSLAGLCTKKQTESGRRGISSGNERVFSRINQAAVSAPLRYLCCSA